MAAILTIGSVLILLAKINMCQAIGTTPKHLR